MPAEIKVTFTFDADRFLADFERRLEAGEDREQVNQSMALRFMDYITTSSADDIRQTPSRK